MKKSIISLMLVVCMAAGIVLSAPITTFAATEGIYTYEVSNGKATITKCAESASGDIIIPSTLGGYPVTTIGDQAFYCSNLTNISILSNIVDIGTEAFSRCSNLMNIYVASNNKNYASVDGNLFSKDKTKIIQIANGKKYTHVVIPDGVTTIGVSSFRACSLESVSIPDSVKVIDDKAFYNCYRLTNVDIPDSVTTIGDEAFYYCYNLASANIGDGVTIIGDNAFCGCTKLANVIIGAGVVTIGNYAFERCTKLTNVNIGDGVTTIGSCAFRTCTSLTNICLPSSVATIGKSAFYNCQSLTSVEIGDSVTTIGAYAFWDCTNLTDVYYAGSKEDWEKIVINDRNTCLTDATIHYNYDPDKLYIEEEQYIPQNKEIANDGKVVKVSADKITKNEYPKYTTAKLCESVNLVGNWNVKNTTIETDDIEDTLRIELGGDLVVENGVFKISKGTTMTVDRLIVGTGGKVIVDGVLNARIVFLNGGDSENAGGYLAVKGEMNVNSYAEISQYGYINISGNMYVGNYFLIKTKNTNNVFANGGELWLKGDLIQKKGGVLTKGNNFCPEPQFRIILIGNREGNVEHELDFQAEKASYISELYIITGDYLSNGYDKYEYENTYSGDVTVSGSIKEIASKIDKYREYVFVKDTTQFKKEKDEWLRAFQEEFNVITDNNRKTYVTLSPSQYTFTSEFGENTYKALQAYFGCLCLSMTVDPPTSFDYIGLKNQVPHDVTFYNEKKGKFEKRTFYIDAINASTAGIRSIRCKSEKDGDIKIIFMLMHGDITKSCEQFRNLIASNYGEYYADVIGLPLNLFYKQPEKNIAQLLWSGIKGTKIKGIRNTLKATIGDYITSDSFINFVSDKTGYNPQKGSLFQVEENSITEECGQFEVEMLFNAPTQLKSGSEDYLNDDSFERAIRDELLLDDNQELTVEMLSSITELALPEKNITNVCGIEQMTSLKTIDLSGNAITDITPLANLTQLSTLNLSGNNIVDITSLGNLTNLKHLSLNSNFISNLQPIANLCELQTLDIGNNRITDITALNSMNKITQLNVSENEIESLAPISSMDKLEILFAQGNKIQSISNVLGNSLKRINLSDNALTGIAGLGNLKVTEIDLSNNPITKATELKTNKKLKRLLLGDTHIDNETLMAIAENNSLTELYLQNTEITDVEPIASLSQLEKLSIAGLKVKNIDALNGVERLKMLDISDTELESFSLDSLDNLEQFYADNCGLDDTALECVSKMKNLKVLTLSSNYITSVDFVEELKNLGYMDVSNNSYISKEDILQIQEKYTNEGKDFVFEQNKVSVDDVYVPSDKLELKVGEVINNFAQIFPYNYSKENVVYKSSNEGVVEYVDNVLTVVGQGDAIVCVEDALGNVLASCDIMAKTGDIKIRVKDVALVEKNIKVTVQSLSENDLKNIHVIVATYKDNKMIDAKSVPMSIAVNTEDVIDVTDIQISEANNYRVFILDDCYKPVAMDYFSWLYV